MKNCRLILFSLVFSVYGANADTLTNVAERVGLIYSADLQAADGNPDVWVRPGLIADRKAREVHFYAESTGLGANEIVEFLVIGQGSGHDYESFAVSHAGPSDIHHALEFIGMSKGRSVDSSALAFWPKGERVVATMTLVDAPSAADTNSVWQQPVRLESLVWNHSKGTTMKAAGFVFTGSRWAQLSEDGTNLVYAADAQEPRSILSTYNEPQTVLDVPWQASKASVYATQQMRESHVLPKATLLKISVVPERLDGEPRVLDLGLRIAPRDAQARALTDADFSVWSDTQALLLGPTNLPTVVKHFADIVAAEQDPFVALQFADDAPLGLVQSVSAVLGELEGENGIRIEPALPGQLYYRAFNPPEQNRTRETRMSQPWELHLAQGSNGWSATLIDVKAIYAQGAAEPEFEVNEYPVASSLSLREQLDAALRAELGECAAQIADAAAQSRFKQRLEDFSAVDLWGQAGEAFFQEIQDALYDEQNYGTLPDKVRRLRVILVYATPGLSHGDLMTFLKETMTTHATVHVYLPLAAR